MTRSDAASVDIQRCLRLEFFRSTCTGPLPRPATRSILTLGAAQRAAICVTQSAALGRAGGERAGALPRERKPL
jgi:hypothetical protein